MRRVGGLFDTSRFGKIAKSLTWCLFAGLLLSVGGLLIDGGRAMANDEQPQRITGPLLVAARPVPEDQEGVSDPAGESPLEEPDPATETDQTQPEAETADRRDDDSPPVDDPHAAEVDRSGESGESVQKLPPAGAPTSVARCSPSSSLAPSAAQPQVVGEPLAASMVTLMQKEMVAGLKRRGIAGNFTRFRSYAGAKLDASARYSGSEVTGKCRLRWYDHLLRNPLRAPAEAEEFTRVLHQAVVEETDFLADTLTIAAEKLDLPPRRARAVKLVHSAEEALEAVRQALLQAQMEYAAALAPLDRAEIRTLRADLYPVFTSDNKVGHTLRRHGTGRHLCDLLEKLDRDALLRAVEALAPLADRPLLDQLATLPDEGEVHIEGTRGRILRRIETPGGAIVIGGRQSNQYYLDQMPGVSVVIDLAGDDAYFEGTVSTQRPVLVVLDLSGNDGHRGTKPGVQGGGMLGISMLVDRCGNDIYQAKDIAQGSCLAGAGILVDYEGDDVYIGLRRAQGAALGGVGLLIDRAGDDRYHAAMWAQGFGGPLGLGLLDDLDGKDLYYGGGLYLTSYVDDDNPTPGYEGWAQGVGAGLRGVSDGGIGVILDGGGDDVYEYDYLSHGGGYWCGSGFARDFGGNDLRLGATRKAYNGQERSQRRFQRFSNGFGCHYALGFLFDDQGNDSYTGTIMCLGFAWDCAVAYLCDFGGNDRYIGTQGNGAQAGLGAMFDYDGDDVYNGSRQGRASAGISYHSLPQCGGNFGFVIDYGGTDKYGCGAPNNTYRRRASAGGFLIDRPKEDDTEKTAATSKKNTAGS